MKLTETYMEESELDPERGNSEQKDSGQDALQSSYIKEGLFLSHGRRLDMKSLTWTRKPCFADFAAHNRLKHH